VKAGREQLPLGIQNTKMILANDRPVTHCFVCLFVWLVVRARPLRAPITAKYRLELVVALVASQSTSPEGWLAQLLALADEPARDHSNGIVVSVCAVQRKSPICAHHPVLKQHFDCRRFRLPVIPNAQIAFRTAVLRVFNRTQKNCVNF
jgi:hypothetical protein